MPDLIGTWIYYQGIPCDAVAFKRSRGWEGDVAEVTVSVTRFPSLGFGNPAMEDAQVAELQIALASGPLPELPELLPRGNLVMSEGPGGAGKTVTVEHMYVVRVDAVQHADADPPACVRTVAVRLTLFDGRFFLLARGVAPRWRYNDTLPGGLPDGSTLLDGEAWTRAQVARDLAQYVALGSRGGIRGLAYTPQRWDLDRGRMVFPRFGLAGAALRILTERKDGAAVPCLRLGGALALHSIGDGRVGWASQQNGPNDSDLPLEQYDQLEGRGQLLGCEAQYPDQFAVVTGKPRVATVALDDWEPCLFVRGTPFYLSEQLVRALTNNRFGLAWLRKAVMLEGAFVAAGLESDVAELFSAQAYRLFRLPGAELIADGFYTGEPGPNAHLLPILDRAETAGGRRLAPVIEIYSWEMRHRSAVSSGPGAADRLNALAKIQEVLRKMAEVSTRLQIPNPLGQSVHPEDLVDDFNLAFDPLAQRGGIGPDLEWTQVDQFVRGKGLGALGVPGIDKAELGGYLDEWRRIKATEKRLGGLGSDYARARRDKLAADDRSSGGASVETWELAEKLVDLELQQLQRRNAFESLQEALERVRLQVDAAVKEANDKVLQKQLDAESKRAAGVPAVPEQARFVLNIDRGPDTGATVWNAQAGVVRCSKLAGHAREPAPDPGSTSLVDCPVRVVFGARMRPAVALAKARRPVTQVNEAEIGDKRIRDSRERRARAKALLEQASEALRKGEADAYAKLAGEASELLAEDKRILDEQYAELRTRTANAADDAVHGACPGGDNIIPEVLSDTEAYYTAAFRRVGQGAAERVQLDAVPLEQATPVPVDWTELVPLSGGGNLPRLDSDAEQLARQLFASPDKVEGWQRSMHGAWPVQVDGLVSQVSIISLEAEGAPCGFRTTIIVGGVAAPLELTSEQTAERRRPS